MKDFLENMVILLLIGSFVADVILCKVSERSRMARGRIVLITTITYVIYGFHNMDSFLGGLLLAMVCGVLGAIYGAIHGGLAITVMMWNFFVLIGVFEPIRLFDDQPTLWADILAEICGFEVGWIKAVAAMGLSAVGLVPGGHRDAEDIDVPDLDVFDT